MKTIFLKSNESVKKMFVDGSRYAVVVFNSEEELYYAIINGQRSTFYKTFGHCQNLVFRNDYSDYISEYDISNIRKNIVIK